MCHRPLPSRHTWQTVLDPTAEPGSTFIARNSSPNKSSDSLLRVYALFRGAGARARHARPYCSSVRQSRADQNRQPESSYDDTKRWWPTRRCCVAACIIRVCSCARRHGFRQWTMISSWAQQGLSLKFSVLIAKISRRDAELRSRAERRE